MTSRSTGREGRLEKIIPTMWMLSEMPSWSGTAPISKLLSLEVKADLYLQWSGGQQAAVRCGAKFQLQCRKFLAWSIHFLMIFNLLCIFIIFCRVKSSLEAGLVNLIQGDVINPQMETRPWLSELLIFFSSFSFFIFCGRIVLVQAWSTCKGNPNPTRYGK